jgi:hypothetical protein
MKVKIVVVDLEIPPGVKKWGLRVGIPLAVVLGGGAAAYAAGLVTWTDGQMLTAADLNANFAYVTGQITALQTRAFPPSGFRATLSTGPNVPSGASVQVAFDSVSFDLGSEYNATSGTFTPKNAGYYTVTCHLQFSASTASGLWRVSILDGANVISTYDIAANLAAGSLATTTFARIAAGDNVTCTALQNSGGNLSLITNPAPTFSAARLY